MKHEIASYYAVRSLDVARSSGFRTVRYADRRAKIFHSTENPRWHVASHGDHRPADPGDGKWSYGAGLAACDLPRKRAGARAARSGEARRSGPLLPSVHPSPPLL